MLSFISFSIAYFLFAKKHFLNFDFYLLLVSIVLFFKLGVFIFFKTHITILRYTTFKDIFRLFIAISCASFILFFTNNFLKSSFKELTTSNFVLLFDFFFSITSIIGYRLALRYLINEGLQNSLSLVEKRIAIVGTDYQSILTKHYLDYEREIYKYHIVAFFTVDESFIGKSIEGTPVYHINKLSTILEIQDIDSLILVEKNDYTSNLDLIKELCTRKEIDLVENQNLKQWVALTPKNLNSPVKSFQIEDLLHRDPIQLDLKNISTQLKNQVVLVTGAAGSIGSELCHQILKFQPKKLIIVDQAESPLFEIENYLLQTKSSNLVSYIASVYDFARMKGIFEIHRPNIVFHAAAYKHVPLMELHPYEALKTNLLGTKILADLSIEFEVEKFILISTDKAVNPTNVMGASKRAAEMYVQSVNHDHKDKTKFITTRFGNVLGSNGSVIPIFKKQIEKGGPVIVTHPDITRFFMTIPEACQLVLEAGSIGQGSEIYIFDMGESVKILDLARNMIKMYGLKENEDIKIEFSGLRPGEKLFEELLADKENTLPTHNPKIMIAKNSFKDVMKVNETIEKIRISIQDYSDKYVLVKELKDLIPEYVSKNSDFETLDKKEYALQQ